MPYSTDLLNTLIPNIKILFRVYGPDGIDLGLGWYILIAMVIASAFMMVRNRK